MIKVRSISKLMSAVSEIRNSGSNLISGQIQNTKDKLNSGIDVFGRPFAPYKDQKRFRGKKPLSKAASLFDDARIDVSNSSRGDVEFRATISGEAAKIANYQNVNRKFVGYSTEDRREATSGFREIIRRGFKNAGN